MADTKEVSKARVLVEQGGQRCLLLSRKRTKKERGQEGAASSMAESSNHTGEVADGEDSADMSEQGVTAPPIV